MDEHVDGDGTAQEPGESPSLQGGSVKASRVMRIKPNSRKSSKKQVELDALEQRLEARIREEVERRFISAKDKRWAELERQYGQLSALSARAKVDPDQQLEPAMQKPPASPVHRILQQANLENDPEALRLVREARGQGAQAELRLLADLAELALRRVEKPAAKASAVILPSGGGLPAPDLRAEYERRLTGLRAGDVAGLSELKREFRGRGLEVY